MQIKVCHSIRGRLRVQLPYRSFTVEQAAFLEQQLMLHLSVEEVKVYLYTGQLAIRYQGSPVKMMELLRSIDRTELANPPAVEEYAALRINQQYKEKLIGRVLWYYGRRLLGLPLWLRTAITCAAAVKHLRRGIQQLKQKKLSVEVLDATAITASIVRGDIATAGSVMFLLSIGELLEEWTHKRSVSDLAKNISLNVDKVWKLDEDGTEQLVSIKKIRSGDTVIVHAGNTIPVDGTVISGEVMVNQSSLTGEAIAVRKAAEATVYAGTVVEEGSAQVLVKSSGAQTKLEHIVHMIEDSEKLKSDLETAAFHLADRLVPFSFLGTVATFALTRNIDRALAFLMVDYSCALKLSMPLAVLAAMKEASRSGILVKGGRFMEQIADIDTIVFDKTGTLTKAQPRVAEVIPFGGRRRDEMLRMAACLEEHFPHAIANAVVTQALEEGLEHNEMHTEVEYIVAHGIASMVEGERVLIGSAHFIFDDEKVTIRTEDRQLFDQLPPQYSHLFLAIGGELAAVICIEDTLREEAQAVIHKLRRLGIENIVMMTGDSKKTAVTIAKRLGIDEYYAEVLPEDKAAYIVAAKQKGRRVMMIGDGINDSPALSAADVGVAMSDGSALAREIADITISAGSLEALIILRQISVNLMKRIRRNYRRVVAFNSGLIGLGTTGLLTPASQALAHNLSTLALGIDSMRPTRGRRDEAEAELEITPEM